MPAHELCPLAACLKGPWARTVSSLSLTRYFDRESVFEHGRAMVPGAHAETALTQICHCLCLLFKGGSIRYTRMKVAPRRLNVIVISIRSSVAEDQQGPRNAKRRNASAKLRTNCRTASIGFENGMESPA